MWSASIQVAKWSKIPEQLAKTSCVEVIEGSATEIPVGDGQFDSVAALQVYEYVEDVGLALAEARRVLN